MSVSEGEIRAAERGGRGQAPPADAPVVLEVRDLEKQFSVPEHRIDTFKERFVHPFRKAEARRLQALEGISFDVRQGEFIGIVGRNGSGKSTLLKILASIYRADAGTIRMAGRLAPFIELGVGFNQDLSARENVILNAVMMGLTPDQAHERLDAVFEFAELDEFRELKLKNYSSGMTVRLAFSVMLQADADIMLIDEVLAVGDAAFQQKCADIFHEMRDSGKTVVLVTHDMMAVQTYCHRAILLHDGNLVEIGDPEEVGKHYIRLNFAGDDAATATSGVSYEDGEPRWSALPDLTARKVEARLVGEEGEAITNVESGHEIRLRASIEAIAELVGPVFALHCNSAEGVHVFTLHRQMGEESDARVLPGERVELNADIENRLTPGRYYIECWVASHGSDISTGVIELLDFVVFGRARELGVIYVDAEMEVIGSAGASDGEG